MGLVENMPSGDSFKPGDVIFSRSGHSIQVDNTDAEGRLVLADLLGKLLQQQPKLVKWGAAVKWLRLGFSIERSDVRDPP